MGSVLIWISTALLVLLIGIVVKGALQEISRNSLAVVAKSSLVRLPKYVSIGELSPRGMYTLLRA